MMMVEGRGMETNVSPEQEEAEEDEEEPITGHLDACCRAELTNQKSDLKSPAKKEIG